MRRIFGIRSWLPLAACLALSWTSSAARSQEEAPLEPVPVEMNPLRLGSQPRGKPSGRWVEWRAGAKWEGQYEDGKRQGVWDAVVPITEDSCFGDSLYEGFESPLSLRVTLHENVPHGEVSAVDASDRPVFTWHFDQGVLEGKATWWHPNGQTRRQVTYRAGLLDGPVAEWNADGKITLQQTYREGRASSSQIEWHEPGRKHFEGYSDLPGEVTRHSFDWIELSWSETAVHEHTSEERCGRWTAWYPNGQKKVQGSYQDGEAEGRFTWWHENGQKMAEGEYVAGRRHGPWRFWHANGRKQLEGRYEYGETDAEWEAWTAEGRPAAIDRTKPLLALDWDQAAPQPGIAQRSAPVARPTRRTAAVEPLPQPIEAQPAKPAAPQRPATVKTPVARPGRSSVMTGGKTASAPRTESGETPRGLFPELFPSPATAATASRSTAAAPLPQGSSQEFTLLGVFLPELTGTTARPATGQAGVKTPSSKAPLTTARPQPESLSHPETPRSLLDELFGFESSPPPSRNHGRPVRR